VAALSLVRTLLARVGLWRRLRPDGGAADPADLLVMKGNCMNYWRCFLDSLDTGGGHIFVLVFVVAFGVWLFFHDNTAGGQIINLSIGALLTILTLKKSNREQIAETPLPDPDHPVTLTTSSVVASTKEQTT
jgi:hypothetical protein